jgi:ABC-type bacteriocin/lantibiotic exporter with double-glycine peptidase domain
MSLSSDESGLDTTRDRHILARVRYQRLAIILAPVAISAGCILSPIRAYDPRRISPGSICLDVPIVRQPDQVTCGLCVAEMLSQYYRMPISDEDRDLIRRRAVSEQGTPAKLLKAVLERSGFRVIIFKGESLDGDTPTSITYHLRKKRPLVVMVSARGRRDHYMVVSGRDVANDMIIFEDPGKGHVMCRGWVFRRMWAQSDFLVLLAVPDVKKRATSE